jgi:hypothetical protein
MVMMTGIRSEFLLRRLTRHLIHRCEEILCPFLQQRLIALLPSSASVTSSAMLNDKKAPARRPVSAEGGEDTNAAEQQEGDGARKKRRKAGEKAGEEDAAADGEHGPIATSKSTLKGGDVLAAILKVRKDILTAVTLGLCESLRRLKVPLRCGL